MNKFNLEKLEKTFSRDDLKDGDIVTLRYGDRLAYIGKYFIDMTGECDNELYNLSELQKDLTYSDFGYKNENYDIMKIERPVEYKTGMKEKKSKKQKK